MKKLHENVINKMKKIVKNKSAMKIDGVMVDLYTASAVTKIYDIVNPANKKKMEKMSPQGLAAAAFKILGKKESVSEDTSGMNPKQKMKFDQLMKKLDGGKEHMKFKRMAKTPVQGDDMFHGYVKDLAMKEEVGTRQSGPITLSKERKAKLVKVFDSLKVGDTVKIKFKRGGFEKQIPIRKKEVLRTRNRGWTRITFGDGVYLYKDPEEGRVVYAHGRMPAEVMDMIKESLDEAMREEEAGFSDAQLQKMKKSYSTIKRIDPSSQNYKKLKTKISELDVDRLEQIARAKIRFVSMIAAGEYAKKSGKRLHARDYMESTELEETVQINEVQQKEVDALKKLSKDMQAVLKGYQKIVVMGDKELKDTKYNKDYEAVLKSRDTILSLIGKVNFRKAQIELKNMKESLEENVKISFHSKGAKTKWMKKQAVASKEIIKQTPTSVELPSRWKDLSKKKDHDEIFSVVVERKLTDAEMDKREKVAKAIEKDSPDMPMGKKMAICY